MDYNQLIQKAMKAQKSAYVPYSHFPVGACLLAKDGSTYTGCNIENATFGATNCAERTAIFKAVSEGQREFEAIAVVGGDITSFTFPCGICLQVMLEFMPEGSVILTDGKERKEFKVKELLPYGFTL